MRTAFGILPVLLMGTAWAQDATVVLGGTGAAPYFQGTLDKIAEQLTSDGVKVKILSGDPRPRTALLEEMRQPGYQDLLYVTLHNPRDNPSNSSRGDVEAACFVGGKKMWEEKSKGPLFLPSSKEHEVNSMVSDLVKKIARRIGGPCLSK